MTDNFKAQYEVADGYVGKSRPQSFTIRAEDIDVSPNMTNAQLEDARSMRWLRRTCGKRSAQRA